MISDASYTIDRVGKNVRRELYVPRKEILLENVKNEYMTVTAEITESMTNNPKLPIIRQRDDISTGIVLLLLTHRYP